MVDQSVAGLAGFAISFNVRLKGARDKNCGCSCLNPLDDCATNPGPDAIKDRFAGAQP